MSQHIKTWQERMEGVITAGMMMQMQATHRAMEAEIAELRAALAATPPQPAPQPGDLHDAIKGIRPPSTLVAKSDAYNKGFADARHAAAELVAASVQQDKQDAELLDFVEAHPEMSLRKHKKRWSFVGFTNYEYETFPTAREAIRAAMAARKEPK
jgi:hypothetical protein